MSMRRKRFKQKHSKQIKQINAANGGQRQMSRTQSRKCYTFNLNIYPPWQLLDRHTASCGFVLNPFCIFRVHFGKVLHVCEEYLCFDDLVERGASLIQNGGESLQAGRGSLAHGTFNNVSLRIRWQLTGAVDGVRCFDGLGLEMSALHVM